jgi:two-component system nitrogen regulation sensor histidine kinase GlnL
MTVQNKILDNLTVAILLFNANLELTYINIAGEILLGDSSRHLKGKSAQSLFINDTKFIKDLEKSISHDEAFVNRELSLRIQSKNITINISATPIIEHDKATEILIELIQVDRHLRISKEEQLLDQQNTSRMLMRGFAHEIKNPLGGLRGAAQLLAFELEDNELTEYTKIIIEETDRMTSLMDKMLGPNKVPNKVSFNLHEALERVRQLVQAEVTDSITLVRDYDPSIPELQADKNQLIQVFLNIVRNAAQAIEGNSEGKITLYSRVIRQMTIAGKHHKLTAKIDIIDNGSGIKPELMSQIFYPMITGRSNGTGLGLPIAQSIINQYHGIIECSSTPDETIFSVYIPVGNVND